MHDIDLIFIYGGIFYLLDRRILRLLQDIVCHIKLNLCMFFCILSNDVSWITNLSFLLFKYLNLYNLYNLKSKNLISLFSDNYFKYFKFLCFLYFILD